MKLFNPCWTHRAVAILLSAVLLGGCAFQNYLDRGHDHAARGDYRAALAEYDRALRHDSDSDKARRLRDQVRPYAIDQATAEMHVQLKARRYEDALAEAKYVARLDPKKGNMLKGEILEQMMAELDNQIAEGRLETAYVFGARIDKLFPTAKGVAKRRAIIRRALYTKSESALARGDHADAIEALAPVARYDRTQARIVSKRRRDIRNAWADTLVSKAKKAESEQHNGVAAAHYARAYEVAQRPEDRAALRRLAPTLARQAAFILAVKPDKDSRRAQEVAAMLEHNAIKLSGVRLPADADGATMVAALSAAPMACDQLATQSTATQEYVAGSRWVANAQYERIDGQLRGAKAKAQHLANEVATERRSVKQKRAAAERCRRLKQIPARKARDAAASARDAARVEVEHHEQRIAELERRLARARRARRKKGFVHNRSGIRERLAHERRQLQDAKLAYAKALQKSNRAKKHDEYARGRCSHARYDADKATRQLREKETFLQWARALVGQRSAKLARTPEKTREDVIEEFRFPVSHVTRRCIANSTMELKAAWDAAPTIRKSKADASTQDDTHPAYPQYGVSSDPLQFPFSDANLIQRTDRLLVKRLLKTVQGRVVDYYEYMSDRAFEWRRDDPDAATDIMVALVLAGRTHIAKNTLARFATHMNERHGLKKLDSLTL